MHHSESPSAHSLDGKVPEQRMPINNGMQAEIALRNAAKTSQIEVVKLQKLLESFGRGEKSGLNADAQSSVAAKLRNRFMETSAITEALEVLGSKGEDIKESLSTLRTRMNYLDQKIASAGLALVQAERTGDTSTIQKLRDEKERLHDMQVNATRAHQMLQEFQPPKS